MEMEAYGDLSDNEQILNFLKVFRPVECVWCDHILAFQHKATGGFYCARQTEEGIQKHSSCYLNALHPKMSLLQKSPGGMNKVLQPLNAGNGVSRHIPEVETVYQAPNTSTVYSPTSTERASSTTRQIVLMDDKDTTVPKVVTSVLPTTDITDSSFSKSSESLRDKSAPFVQHVETPIAAPILKKQPISSTSASTVSNGETFAAKSDQVAEPYLWSNCPYSTNIASTSAIKVAFPWSATTLLITSKKDEKSMDKLQELIQKHVQKAKPLNAPPEVGEMVISKYEDDFYRGKISKVREDKCRIEFVDFGDAIICKYSEILPVNEEIMQHPLYGMTVHLEGLPSDSNDVKLTPKVEDMIYSSVRIEFCRGKPVSPSEDVVGVELFDDAGVSVNGKLRNALWPAGGTVLKTDKTLEVVSTVTPAVHMWSQCKFSPNLTQGTKVYILFQYSVTTYHIVAEADEGELNKVLEVVAEYIKKAKPLTRPPIRDQIVIGSYSDQYFRGRVEKVEGENAMICFVDNGDKALCKVSELFPVDDTIMKLFLTRFQYPIYGLMVQLNKVPEPPEKFQFTKEFEPVKSLFDETLTLDFIKVPKDNLVIPEDGSYVFQTRLWGSGDNCINAELARVIRSLPS